jgi:hypothetical protein
VIAKREAAMLAESLFFMPKVQVTMFNSLFEQKELSSAAREDTGHARTVASVFGR